MTTEQRRSTLEPTFPLWVLWTWKWTVLGVAVTVGAISLALGLTRTVRYEAIALLASEVRQIPGETGDPRVLESYIEVTRQALLMHAEVLRSDAARMAIGKSAGGRDPETVKIRLRAEVAREPTTLRIAAWDEEPARAAALANAAATYAVAHTTTTNPRIDADRQTYLDKLRMEFDARLALEAQALAEELIQADRTKMHHRITVLRGEVLKLEDKRNQVGLYPAELLSIDKALSVGRDELNRLQVEQDVVNRTLERLGRETRFAASAYEGVHSAYLQSSLSVVSRMADLRLVQAAEVPRQPMTRHLNIIVGIGVLCGLMIGSLNALYVEYVRAQNRRRETL